MTKRPTKREQLCAIYAILADAGNTELAEFVAGQIAQLDKRKNAPKAMTKAQLENVAIKIQILDILDEVSESPRATELANEVGISVQKCSALLRQLVLDGGVIREVNGKVTTFRRS